MHYAAFLRTLISSLLFLAISNAQLSLPSIGSQTSSAYSSLLPDKPGNYDQQKVRTASPPIVRIELSGQEPALSGIPSEVVYAQGGYVPSGETLPHPFWFMLPSDLDQGGHLVACGYVSGTPPTPTLTSPSGRTSSLTATAYSYPDMAEASYCWQYRVAWAYGIELGLYTLTLEHSQGNLAHTWGIDYPYCRNVMSLSSETHSAQDFLMGFNPNQMLTLLFYAYVSGSFAETGSFRYRYIATRSAQVDAEGALVLDINVTRAAPFAVKMEDEGVQIDGLIYYILGPQKELLFTYPAFSKEFTGIYLESSSQPEFFQKRQSAESCDGNYGSTAVTSTRSGDLLALYPAYNDTSRIIGQMNLGIVVNILERQIGVTNGRVEVWYRIRSEDGNEGWSYGPNLLKLGT